MLRATSVLPAGHWRDAVDRVVLDHAARHRRRLHYHAEGGLAFLLDLPRARVLADGDGLVLEDGRVIAVVAAAEPLIEVTAADGAALLAIAWHIGNRHLPAELLGTAIRLRADHVIADMLRGLGGTVTAIAAPFNPETGAYAGGHGDHHHHHDDHAHDHAPGHHHDH
ncbi:MAG: urease accessory protein UreE [Alphaproteobacteria bacterium]|nr:MAG: urease accessory protein UreE [Alphaproteobacteria bacterium]